MDVIRPWTSNIYSSTNSATFRTLHARARRKGFVVSGVDKCRRKTDDCQCRIGRTTTRAAGEILRLNWTVCLRNGDLNKSRFSHGLTDKSSKPLFISFGSRRLVNYFAAFGAMASRFSTRRARAPCGLRGVMRP